MDRDATDLKQLEAEKRHEDAMCGKPSDGDRRDHAEHTPSKGDPARALARGFQMGAPIAFVCRSRNRHQCASCRFNSSTTCGQIDPIEPAPNKRTTSPGRASL